MSDIVIPPELVDAQRRAEEAFRAVGAWAEGAPDTLADRWAAVYQEADAAHALRAPLVAAHGSWAVSQALGLAMRQDDNE
ncbi:hypothetical protein [Actinacidiphila oryziradicis]|uniref:Uncharacterized protein n=1 Tax=Actinacidiphila oryziradicis TaxID=2571141 RepID=A0A4U0RN60_9ACTN|nr:hypothetical protein [Actinacidiphila oryziradicis]TJZ96757.1 hypothetical protein FCI23_50610 [Actinacidiphila oryziradicis]